MAHKKAGGSSRNGREFGRATPRREALRRRDRSRRQHPHPPARHQMARRPRGRPRQGPHDFAPARRDRRLPDQSQRPHLCLGQPDGPQPTNSRHPKFAGVTSTRRHQRIRKGEMGRHLPFFFALVGGSHAGRRGEEGRIGRPHAAAHPAAPACATRDAHRLLAANPRSPRPRRCPRRLRRRYPSPWSSAASGAVSAPRLGPMAERPRAAVASWIGEPHWGRGSPPRRRRLIDHVFADDGVLVLWCSNRASNARARRVIEKCGFQFRETGMVRSPTLSVAVPVERFVLDRRNWASLKSWGAGSRGKKRRDAPRDNAA